MKTLTVLLCGSAGLGDIKGICSDRSATICVDWNQNQATQTGAHELGHRSAANPLHWRHNGRLKSPTSRLFAQPFVEHIKENIKAPRHWPLWGESTGDRWIPLTKGR